MARVRKDWMVRRLISAGLFLAATAAQAQDSGSRAGALAEIRISASALCQAGAGKNTPPISRLTDEADAELFSLIKALTGLDDVKDTALDSLSADEAVRSALASAIAAGDNCEQTVFDSLTATIFGADRPGVAGALDTQAPVDDASDQQPGTGGDASKDIQGYWYSPRYRYGFAVTGTIGVAIVSNAPRVYAAGDTMLRIDGAEKDTLTGMQIFTNGRWYPVRITLQDSNLINLEGGGFKWDMCRANWDGGRIGDPPCLK